MKEPYLAVTFRHGQALAAYYYLPRAAGEVSARTRRVEPGMLIDYNANGSPIGIEITAPSRLSLEDFNQVLQDLGLPRASVGDLAPLHAG